MSGGIKYRLTPRERALFAEQLGLFEALRDRLKPNGIDAKLDDAELEVSVEEGPEGPEFALEIPFDTDLVPQNGRLYVKDAFQLSKAADRILSFERSLRQDLNTNKRIGYWVSVARKDHPDAKITAHAEHLRRFLEDLGKLPKPAADDPPLQRFLGGVLSRLHRPFPDGNEALVRKNFAVFSPVLEKTVPFGVRMKFGDPQSGLVLRREGDKIFLSVQVVMDSDPKPGLEAEKNGRMFLIDSYEIDPASGRILNTGRELVPSEVPGEDFDQAYAAVKDSPPPSKDSPELQALAAGWLKDLLPAQAPVRPGPAAAPVVAEAPQDPAGKILYALYRFTERDGEAGKRFFETLARRSTGTPLTGVLAVPELDRAALRDALAAAISGDAAKAEAAIAAWLGEKGLQAPTRTLLQALAQYSRGEWEPARRSLTPLLAASPFARQVHRAIEIRSGHAPRALAAEVLKTAAAERIEQANRHDQAWFAALSDGLAGKVSADPEQRRLAVLSFFKSLDATLGDHAGDLASALEATPAQGSYEKEVKDFLRGDATLRQLTALLDEPDAGLRESGLLVLARGALLGKAKLPATAKRIAESLAPGLDGAQDLKNWFSGKADLGQKVEMLLPAFAEEVLAPRTLFSMAAAGALGQIAKAAFFARAGYQTRRLRWAAEAFSVGVEAPAFVLTEKLIVSATDSPEGQWGKLPRDTLGALLAFGTLRGAGIASRRFNRYLADSKGLEAWAEGRSRLALAERWQPHVEKFAQSEGKARPLRWAAGKTAVPALEYLGKTGLPRAWVKRSLPQAGAHAMGLGGLMAANSLTRLLSLRDASQQGYAADLVDDFLMYGHFLVAGHIAGRLGRGDIDARIAFLEAQPLQTKPAKAKSPAKQAEKTETRDSDPAATPPESKPGETPPKVDVPPEIKEFGRNLLRWLKEDLPQVGKLAREWYQARRAPPGTAGKNSATPSATTEAEGSPPPPTEPPTSAPEIAVAKAPSQPPAIPEGKATPVPPAPRSALLEPAPEAVNFRRIESEPPSRGKGEEHKVLVEVLGREEELRFRDKETRKQLVFEAVLGREDIQSPPQAVGIDFGFSSTEGGIAPRHAKIRVEVTYETKVEVQTDKGRGKIRVPLASAKEWKFSLEDLGSPGGTFLNGERVSKPAPLKDQDRICLGENGFELRLRLDRAEPKAFLIRPGIPLAEGRSEWILGREHAGAEAPDIRFPISDRDLSRRHARIVRDEDGHYFVQDLSWNGTRINLRRIHGSQELRDGDSLQLGNGTELIFALPAGAKAAEPQGPKAVPPHPNAATPPPEQAKVHPAYRNLSPEALEAHFAKLGTEEADFSAFRAGELALPDGRHVLLSSLNTGWAVGHPGEAPANVHSLQFTFPPGATQNPALIYLDGAGRFILRGMRPESSLSIQTRAERFFPPNGEPKKPSARKQAVSGWTVLEGGERVFLGEDFYFDFWPGAPKSPYERPTAVSGEFGSVEVKQNPFASPEAPPPPQKPSSLVFLDGKLQLPLNKAVRIRSRADVTELLLRDETAKSEVEILVPESVAKLQETRFFQEDGVWKIRSEGGEGVPLVLNGMRLPERITLDLLPDTTLEIGDLKIQIRLP